MKKITLLLVSIIVMSCGKTKEELVNEKIKEYIYLSVKDPKSYELIETKFIDDIKSNEYADIVLDEIKSKIETSNKTLSEQELKLKEFKKDANIYGQELILTTEEIISDLNELIPLYEKIYGKTQLKENDTTTVYKVYKHKCKLKNESGAVDVTEYNVYFDDKNNIVVFTTEQKEALEKSILDYKTRYLKL
jgi:hypothetical protein